MPLRSDNSATGKQCQLFRFYYPTVADLGGREGHPVPKFLYSRVVFEKNWSNSVLALSSWVGAPPPELAHPLWEILDPSLPTFTNVE